MSRPAENPVSDTGVVLVLAGEGRATWALGSVFEHILEPGQSDNVLGLAVVTQPPGTATALHRHTREAEAFFMLEGTITYRAGDDMFDLGAGSFIYLPKALPHAFRVTGDVPARFVALTNPGGLLRMYDDVGRPAQERRLPDPATVEEISRWMEIAPQYGLEILGPPLSV